MAQLVESTNKTIQKIVNFQVQLAVGSGWWVQFQRSLCIPSTPEQSLCHKPAPSTVNLAVKGLWAASLTNSYLIFGYGLGIGLVG